MEAIAKAEIIPRKKSYLAKVKDFLSNKKTELIGTALLCGSLASGGCANFQQKTRTLDDFYYQRYVQVIGEIVPGYNQKLENTNENLNAQLIIYDSKAPNGGPLVMNLHEDARFGLNRQALKRAKTGFNSHKYIVKAWGVVTSSKLLNMDLEFIAFTDRDGKLISTVETDIDPIYTLPGVAPIYVPSSSQPDLSIGFWGSWRIPWYDMRIPWQNMWDCWYADWDHDGIPNYMDPYPTIPSNEHPSEFELIQDVMHNPYADLNRYNARLPESKVRKIIGIESLRPTQEYIKLLDHNIRVDELRQKSNIEPKDNSIRKSGEYNPGKVTKSLDARVTSSGREAMVKSYSTDSNGIRGMNQRTDSNYRSSAVDGSIAPYSITTGTGENTAAPTPTVTKSTDDNGTKSTEKREERQ